MLKIVLTAFMLPLLLLFGSHDGGVLDCSQRCKDKSRQARRKRDTSEDDCGQRKREHGHRSESDQWS